MWTIASMPRVQGSTHAHAFSIMSVRSHSLSRRSTISWRSSPFHATRNNSLNFCVCQLSSSLINLTIRNWVGCVQRVVLVVVKWFERVNSKVDAGCIACGTCKCVTSTKYFRKYIKHQSLKFNLKDKMWSENMFVPRIFYFIIFKISKLFQVFYKSIIYSLWK